MRKFLAVTFLVVFTFFLMGNDGCRPKSVFDPVAEPTKAEAPPAPPEFVFTPENVLVEGNFAFITIDRSLWDSDSAGDLKDVKKMLRIFGRFEKEYGPIVDMWDYSWDSRVWGITIKFIPK